MNGPGGTAGTPSSTDNRRRGSDTTSPWLHPQSTASPRRQTADQFQRCGPAILSPLRGVISTGIPRAAYSDRTL